MLTLSLFAGAANAFAGMLWLDLPGRPAAGLFTLIAGLAGIASSARIYLVRARPAWFSYYTIAEFYSTALLLGPLFVQALDGHVPAWVRMTGAAGAAVELIAQLLMFFWLSRSEAFELRASSLLLSGRGRYWFLARLGKLVVAGLVLPLAAASGWMMAAAFVVALPGEWLGRYQFFVSVVPKSLAAAFTSGERMAA